ncbi:P-loop containing nucleoside triphosphate hydrolase protein, partial [Panaeolus papilionaceus]
ILYQAFGYPEFKGKQKEIVEAAYGGADVLVVAPTGMGKSLCFQIPAIADKRGLSVVISPLLALMQNQLDNLRSKNIRVVSLSSQLSYSEREQVMKELKLYDTPIKLLYVTPEGLRGNELVQMLEEVYNNHNLNRLVIDEAHCISEWGHDFRGDYRKLGHFRDRFPDVPIMALTATATSAVQKDIINILKMNDNHLYQALHPFNRSNLFYEIRYLSNPTQQAQMSDIYDFISTLHIRRGKPSSGVVYCRRRATCDELSTYLRGRGINSRPYHRGVDNNELQKTLKGWTEGPYGDRNSVDVVRMMLWFVVATIAFGLGIDKGDVRYVVHYDLPKSFEGYYQETGRAGRDGYPSKCVLYYSREDTVRVKRFIRASHPDGSAAAVADEDEGPSPTQQAAGSLDALIQFAESSKLCRHVSICRYFGEPIDETNEELLKIYCNKMCDVCKYPQKVKLKIANLSSMEAAVQNVPVFSNPSTPSVNQGQQDRSGQWSGRSTPSAGQKRPGTNGDFTPAPAAKKAKPALAPALVTKPFRSVSSLSKPFKPPSFVGVGSSTTSRSSSVKPVVTPSTVKAEMPPAFKADFDTKLMPPPALPAMKKESPLNRLARGKRQDGFDSLRRSFHRVLTKPTNADEIWEKLSSSEVSSRRRNKIIFKVATSLECDAIRMCSTFDGYTARIENTKEDIEGLSNLSLWDKDVGDFNDSQDIIQLLRQNSMSEKPK